MCDKTFTLKVVMSGRDVDNLFDFLDQVVIESRVHRTGLYHEAKYWKGLFEQALEQSTSQPIYRKQGRS